MERCFKSLLVVAWSWILIRKNATLKHFVSARLSDVTQTLIKTKRYCFKSPWYNLVQHFDIHVWRLQRQANKERFRGGQLETMNPRRCFLRVS